MTHPVSRFGSLRGLATFVTFMSAAVGSVPAAEVAAPPPIPKTAAHEPSHPTSIPLWPNGAPGSEKMRDTAERVDWRQEPDIVFPVTSSIHQPSLTPYFPARGKATGAAVIVAPGGGHMFLTMDREGYDVAQWLADHGIAAFVLKYRLARDRSNPEGTAQPYAVEREPLADARRAIRMVRSRAAEWMINPAHIGILGFSAGGEVALEAALQPAADSTAATDPIDRVSARPDFFAPIYPGGLEHADALATKDTPPAFLLCAADDRMPEPLTKFFLTLRKLGVPTELHIYGKGGHGFGIRDRKLAVTTWPARFDDWLGDLGFLHN